MMMTHTPHEIGEEFPEHRAKIHALKVSDVHFAKMMEDYHELNRAIHRAEIEVEPVSDDTMELMKKKRLALKDEIASLLAM
jgi:uncharacterized protein YdcH (DUF465 family)